MTRTAADEAEVIAPERLSSMILAATAPLTGIEFFRGLAERLADTLGVHTVLISECLTRPEHHVRTLAYWDGSGFAEDIEFDLRGTPCEDVISGGQYCFHPLGMRKLFPAWSADGGGVESFVGTPLRSADGGRIVGHIAVFDHRPMHESILTEPVFRVFAMRAAAELERLQTERTAREHLRQLAHLARHRSIGELAGSLVHEISQPLTAVAVYARTLCARLDGANENALALARKMEVESERASELVTVLRRYLRAHEITPRTLSIAAIVTPVIELLQLECQAAGITLGYRERGELPAVKADPILAQQVVLNLVRNALDALASCAPGQARRIELVAEREAASDRVNLLVSDTGCGIPAEMRKQLFSAMCSSKPDGMGIGLALSRSIALEHGGDLVLLRPSDPTTFCLRLPAAAREPTARGIVAP